MEESADIIDANSNKEGMISISTLHGSLLTQDGGDPEHKPKRLSMRV